MGTEFEFESEAMNRYLKKKYPKHEVKLINDFDKKTGKIISYYDIDGMLRVQMDVVPTFTPRLYNGRTKKGKWKFIDKDKEARLAFKKTMDALMSSIVKLRDLRCIVNGITVTPTIVMSKRNNKNDAARIPPVEDFKEGIIPEDYKAALKQLSGVGKAHKKKARTPIPVGDMDLGEDEKKLKVDVPKDLKEQLDKIEE